jgi:5,6-dimethylbenzimidazole synthase
VSPRFDARFRAELEELFRWRRDVRRFRREALPAGTLERLIALAHLSPSVGLSQPWRFVIVDDKARRRAIAENFRVANAAALAAQSDDDARLYATLKLAGLDEAPVQFAVFADRATEQGRGLGRLTMPEMIEYSAVGAVQTLWLAARAEGLGLGWVSILDPAQVAVALDVPAAWHFIGYFCLGVPQEESETPALERQGWERRVDVGAVIVRR